MSSDELPPGINIKTISLAREWRVSITDEKRCQRLSHWGLTYPEASERLDGLMKSSGYAYEYCGNNRFEAHDMGGALIAYAEMKKTGVRKVAKVDDGNIVSD